MTKLLKEGGWFTLKQQIKYIATTAVYLTEVSTQIWEKKDLTTGSTYQRASKLTKHPQITSVLCTAQDVKLYINTPNNGNFLGLVQLLGEFDPVIMEHLRRIVNKETNVHYFGKRIQNKLIGLLGTEVRNKISIMVKSAKYFSIILDCTPDISHVEQLSLTCSGHGSGVRYWLINQTVRSPPSPKQAS
jgi:hypothetical protein